MIKVYDESTIYILCPGGIKSGGPELLHQLCCELSVRGIDSRIVYYGPKSFIHAEYKRYITSFETLRSVIDDSKNIIVAPEAVPELLDQYDHIQKCIWWMSVDNYLMHSDIGLHLKEKGLLRTLKHLVNGELKPGVKFDRKANHLYQSEYAHAFLRNNGLGNCYRLSDYLSDEFTTSYPEALRKDIVLYNPKKGIKFTKKIISASDDLNWMPIENMTTTEICQLMRLSKVFVDFGNHPGKDRMPREAAISGCCVITGKRGSAGYYEDVPIPDEYKFSDLDSNIESIVSKIHECLTGYRACVDDFEHYRNRIRGEKDVFKADILEVFSATEDIGGK